MGGGPGGARAQQRVALRGGARAHAAARAPAADVSGRARKDGRGPAASAPGGKAPPAGVIFVSFVILVMLSHF